MFCRILQEGSATFLRGTAAVAIRRLASVSTCLFSSVCVIITSAGLASGAPGDLDPSFEPGAGAALNGGYSDVATVVVQPDGRTLIGGNFDTVSGTPRRGVARLHADGSLDSSFDPGLGVSGRVDAMLLQPDGRIVIAGEFQSVNGAGRNRIARLHPNGNLDNSFIPTGPSSAISALALQADGKILLGGKFYYGDASTVPGIARLTPSGSVDPTFTPGSGANFFGIYAIALQADGRIVIGGDFRSYDGVTRDRLARLNSNGTLDSSFGLPNTSNFQHAAVYSLAIQTDGKIVAGGGGFPINGSGAYDVARVNFNGTRDASFSYTVQGGAGGYGPLVTCVALQADGKVLVGGGFSSINGIGRNNVARLNPEGSVDATFSPGIGPNRPLDNRSPAVKAIAPEGMVKVLIGGFFTAVNNLPRNSIARLQSSFSHVKGDFNADGFGDFLWQNTRTGERVMWFLRNGLYQTGFYMQTTAPEWRIAGTGDLNGDGHGDFTWQNVHTGEHVVWFLRHGQYQNGFYFDTIPPEWQIASSADLNGDGHADFVWQNTRTGEHVIWFLRDGRFQSGFYFDTIPPEWEIASAADFNADGHADFVWQNTRTGEHVMWFLRDGRFQSGFYFDTIPPQWRIAGAADFNADGHADFVWQNINTGERVMWFLRNGRYQSGFYMQTIDREWDLCVR